MERSQVPPLNLHRRRDKGKRSFDSIPELSRPSSASSSIVSSRSTVAQLSSQRDYYRVPNSSRNRAETSRSNPGPSRFPPLKSDPSVAGRPPSQSSFFDLKARYANLLTSQSPRSTTSQGFVQRSSSEECLKCMLKVPHSRCESHKYIRVGGGYRHSFWYVKALLEEIELRRQQEIVRQQRLEAIHEKHVRAVKTYIRTKSGRLVERIVFLSEEDYQAFKAGGKDAAANILKKYLGKEEAKNLAKWDKEEQKAVTTYIRTKSGRRIAKTVYINKSDYEAMKKDGADSTAILRKYFKPEDGCTLEGWGEAEMKTLKTFIRTKSGRLVEKTILITKEDYERLEKIRAEGGDPNELLSKYMAMEEGATVETWEKKEAAPMTVVKAFVRTKSGRLVEKTVLMTAEEYAEFQASGGDVNLLKKYMDIGKDDVIEDWDKQSTVYSASDDEAIEKGAPGTVVRGKDGELYEIIVDPVTGKKYKKKVKQKPQSKRGGAGGPMKDPHEKGMSEKQIKEYRAGKRRDGSDSEFSYKSHVSAGGTRHVVRRKRLENGTYGDAESYHSDQDEEGKKRRQARRTVRKEVAIKEKKKALAAGKRNENSDSDFSYRSVVSAGGTRRVFRAKKLAGGKRGKEEAYDSDKDEAGKKRRQARRKERDNKIKKGGRNPDSGSDYSYKSVVSAGGTRRVTRRKKLSGGKRGKEEGYNSADDAEGKKRRMDRRKKRDDKVKAGGRDKGSDSDFSYRSVVSAGGTRRVTRRKKLADGTRGAAEVYNSDEDVEGKKRRLDRRKLKEEKVKKGGRDKGSDSEFSYRSVVSAGGTRHVKRRKKLADGTRGEEEDYNSGDDEAGKKRRQARRREREVKKKEKLAKGGRNADSAGSDYSYRSIVSAGGTRHVKRKKKNKDGTYGAEEEYHSSQDEEGRERRKKRRDEKKKKLAKGGRNPGSDSDFSYRSVVSAGGTRTVKRRRKRGDGTYSAEHSYHSDQDVAGQERRKKRRQEKHKAMKEGKRDKGSDSDFSYRSVVSAGGTRRVKRKKKNVDGTYGSEHSYNSAEDEDGKARRRQRRRERKHAGSAHSYFSDVSAGGTRHVKRRRRRADGTYSAAESYHSSASEMFGKGKKGKKKKPPRVHGADSDHSYFSDVSAGGTRTRKRVQRIRDKDGNVIGHGKTENYTSDSSMEYVDDGKGGKVKKKKKVKDPFGGSLASTDSDDEPDLSKMTKAEREKYMSDKAKRKEEREKRRKEKFGDEYEAMMEQHKKSKEIKKAEKSMVHYQKGSDRFKENLQYDNRQPGLGHNDWGNKGKKGGRRGKGDGHDADDESEFEEGPDGVRRRKKRGGKGGDSDGESVYDYVRDEKGNIVRGKDGKPMMKKVGTMKKGGNRKHREGVIDSDSEYEYMKDKHGNVVRKKKGKDGDDSDGDYFEIGEDGQVRLKKGKRKIDLSKLSAEDMKKLGIDPETMTKEEIAKILKAKFGEDISITKAGKRVGLKAFEDCAGANTDDLAGDSDLDTSTLKGQRRVRVLMRKGGQAILDHMKTIITNSDLVDDAHTHPEERNASIDFLSHYRLVDNNKIDMYARAFVVEDEDLDSVCNVREAKQALGGIPTIQAISKKQIEYIQKLLDIDKETHVTFRMFSVMTALAERVTAMDQYCKHLLEVSDLMDIQRKMELYKSMFYCNVRGDRDANYIKAESLRIELIAGGLNWQQQDFIMEKMQPNYWREISFFDYLCYVPLFMSMHDKMVENPLDMSNNKYVPSQNRQPSPVQRDSNPLGHPLKRNTMFIRQKTKDTHMKADDLLMAKKDVSELKRENLELYNKYAKLPSIKKEATPRSKDTGKTKL